MSAGNTFILIYNELAAALQEMAKLTSKQPTFFELLEVARSIPSIRNDISFLKCMGNLRNAIVHDIKYPDTIIADPRQEVLDNFQRILEKIKSPVKVIPKFQRQISVFSPQDPFGEILAHMQQNDYSQVVVYVNSEYRILSSEGIVRWLGSARQVGLADIESATVQDVFMYEEKIDPCYMARNESVDAAILAYENAISKGMPKLPAIIITNSGKSTEKPLGIITPWDLIGTAGNK